MATAVAPLAVLTVDAIVVPVSDWKADGVMLLLAAAVALVVGVVWRNKMKLADDVDAWIVDVRQRSVPMHYRVYDLDVPLIDGVQKGWCEA